MLANNSVTLAAEIPGITQPAASSALKRLRHAFDDLLVRAGRGLVRTPRAEELVEPLDEAMRAIEHLLTLRGAPASSLTAPAGRPRTISRFRLDPGQQPLSTRHGAGVPQLVVARGGTIRPLKAA